ncbi:TnpV protein [Extibacter muris]|uniref:TnpV protein n=1 Tax=Extibacter muris TaxID=1796622 RepID=A0A4R4F8S1_9FIRM|nr:TnpV protein [Extibacter muris]MCU0081272.1 TnpV protein [Extibacter muris]TDA20142.1 TnpV protein [Extibacter muris]
MIPNLTIPDEQEGHVGKYGSLRRTYLWENHYGLFISLMTQGKLKSHLMEIQETAQNRMEQITTEMKAAQNVTEELKASDSMMWVGRMNNIRQSAEEIVMKELIYV